ncbi:hypothetical protein [Desulforamulus aeronauticus]|uniref:hypothetical protein n=1 Tax=Desulforamulus aeronauticus TaxID=53343 RepID=UPI0015870149|nr:hypothetical protein [Desulforamulus aeronauticus]
MMKRQCAIGVHTKIDDQGNPRATVTFKFIFARDVMKTDKRVDNNLGQLVFAEVIY